MLVTATMMAATDSSVVLLAFPDITQTLNTNVSASIWTILVYMLVTAVVTTQLGKIGDIYGRAKMFNSGFVLFTIASALCGASPNIWFLIGFRVLQGLGAAMLLANSGAIIADNFPREKLGRPYGYMAAGWGAGSFLGIVIGGVLTTLLGWRYIFYVNVPIGIVAVILGFRYVKDKNIVKRKLDLAGMSLLGLGLALITYDAINVASLGFSILDGVLISLGVLILLYFLHRESRSEDPLIDFNIFKKRILRFSLLAALLVSMGTFAVFFLITLYLQGVVGLSPLYAALLLAPGALINLFIAPRMGRLSDRIGPRVVATAGTFGIAVSTLVYLMLGASNFSPWIVIIASCASGLGMSLFYPSNNSAVMANAEPGYYGSVNGLLRTLQNTGGLLSYVIVLYIASIAVPRQIAFQVFVGTTHLLGGLTTSFVEGMHAALLGSLVLVIMAGILSYARGRVERRNSFVMHDSNNKKNDGKTERQ